MFKERLPSFLLLLAVACALVFIPGDYGLATFAVVGTIAIYFAAKELGIMLSKIDIPSAPFIASTLATLTFLASIYIGASSGDITSAYMITGLLLVFAILPWQLILRSNSSKIAIHGIIGTLGILFLLFPLIAVVPLYFTASETQTAIVCPLIVYLVLVTKIGGDTCAYCIGSLSNVITKGKNHPIAPSISPKKSWEGTIGAMLCTMAISFVFTPYLLPSSLQGTVMSLILGFILFWGGFFGDLAESALKRATGVKDSGKFLPGTGGMLDVLDSLLFNAPILLFALLVASIR